MNSLENKKALKFVIHLATGKFGSSDNNVIELTGFRASAEVSKTGGLQMSTLAARVYGVSESDMRSVTTMSWMEGFDIHNTIDVFAIDGPIETLVFSGSLTHSAGDYQNAPDVFLGIRAAANHDAQLNAVAPLSISGGADVAIAIERIARALGKTFVNNSNNGAGVHVTLVDTYAEGTLIDQLRALAQAADINVYNDDRTLSITPRNQAVTVDVPVISPDTGLVGYPTFDATGVNFRCLFNPAIVFGGAVQLVTSLPEAAGQWIVDSVGASLESERPNGAWFSNVRASRHGNKITK